ncbi:MAG: cytochrome P450 [Cyanobacteria bacterium P01_A01_bin.123]
MGLPFLGETLEIFNTEERYYWRQFEQYGPIFKTHILGQNFAFLVGPEANRLVLQDQADHVSTTLGWKFVQQLFKDGLLFLEGEEHRRIRRLMYPAFHRRALVDYFTTMQRVVEGFIADWGNREQVPFKADFRELTLIIASRLFLGAQTNQQVVQTSQWFEELWAARLAILRLDVPFTLYGRSQIARRNLAEFLRPIIAERKRQSNPAESAEGIDVLGLLLTATDEDGNHLSDQEVINQAIFFLFAGHETTASVLSWLLYELGSHPQWQATLRSELMAVAGSEPLQISHLNQLPQMGNVLKEIERLYPPVYGIPRGVVKDIEYAGYHIPAGWYINLSPMLTHYLPELFPNPTQFAPERFAPPREEDKRHPFALVGFGNGPHACLGMEFAQLEIKVVLATLLRRYTWQVSPDRAAIAPVRQPSRLQNNLQGVFTGV